MQIWFKFGHRPSELVWVGVEKNAKVTTKLTEKLAKSSLTQPRITRFG